MALFDLDESALFQYQPRVLEPGDFGDFWTDTLALSLKAAAKRRPVFTPILPDCPGVEAWDVEFPGFAGQPIKAWYILPSKKLRGKTPVPCVVEYIGYGGGRGYAHQWLSWAARGYGLFVMDTRGQGSVWQRGDTPDLELEASGPQSPGFMTRGIGSPWTYYYRRVFADAVMAVLTVAGRREIDPGRIVLNGGSQGGGMVLAANGILEILAADPRWPQVRPWAIMSDVPFLCHFTRACTITDSWPYQEIVQYLKNHRDQEDMVFAALAYFDGVNFARRGTCPALFSTGLMDGTCPPSTVFAAYNHYQGKKDIKMYRFNQHEGGQAHHELEKFAFLARLSAPSPAH